MSVKQDDETTITVAVGEKKRAEIAQAIAAALIEGYKKERKIYEKFARIIRDGGGILRKKLKDSFRITVTTEGGIPDVDVNVTENLPNAGSVLQSGHPILEDRIIDGATLEEILDNRIDLGEDVNGIVWKYNLDLQSYRGKKGETIERNEINAALSDAVQKGIEQFYISVGIK
ncbi:MAG: hypothetical protein IPJ30_24810 [Acidobacteria bacterium]|nr:hypothetical protein [Acidobacteriota bacterium]